MTNYIDWEFYSSLFNEVTEAEFDKLLPRVTNKINAITHGRAKAFFESFSLVASTDYQTTTYLALQLTCCEMINLYHSYDNSAIGNGVNSVSNDGYSESYSVNTQSEKEAELLHCVRAGLSGTGLASAL